MATVNARMLSALIDARRYFGTRPDDERAVYLQRQRDNERYLDFVIARKDWYYGEYAVYEGGVFATCFAPALVEQWFSEHEAEAERRRKEYAEQHPAA